MFLTSLSKFVCEVQHLKIFLDALGRRRTQALIELVWFVAFFEGFLQGRCQSLPLSHGKILALVAKNKKAPDRRIHGPFRILNPVVQRAHHPELAEGQRPTLSYLISKSAI